MGFLRLLFSLSVLSFHAEKNGNLILFHPFAAVNSFLIISGFYIALILDSKYHSILAFYINRFLRIYPIYWLVLTITVFSGLIKTGFNMGSNQNAITHYLLYSTHLHGFDFLVEGINFILRNLTLIITKDYFGLKENQAAGFLIVNQSWTLQIELIFYLLAPLILRIKRNFLFYFGIYFIIVYIIIVPMGFFPMGNLTINFVKYLFYFLLGVSAYKYIYKKIKVTNYRKTIYISFGILLFFILGYRFLPYKIVDTSFYTGLIYYIPFAILVPFLFSVFKNNKFDRFIGELSYPIYITHMIVIKTLSALSLTFAHGLNTIVSAILTILLSLIIINVLQKPIDHYRHKLINQ